MKPCECQGDALPTHTYGDPLTPLSQWARCEAERLLAPLGRRWAHTQGVAATAGALASLVVPAERDMAVAAAWLHDVGYAPSLSTTGFHPLDGARHVHALGQVRLARLVAHHTGARYEAKRRGLATELAEFEEEHSHLADLVTYADLTTGPGGLPVNPGQRLVEVAQRYGAGHVVTQALAEARPALLGVVGRVESRLSQCAAAALGRRLIGAGAP